jgi:hypothetical protein
MSHGNLCFAYLSFSTDITLYIFIIDQVVVLIEVHTLVKLVRYTVPNLPIASTGWRLGHHNLGDLRPRCIILTLIGLSKICCHYILYFLSNPSVSFLTLLHSISEYCRILSTPHHLQFIEIDETYFHLHPVVK